MFTWIFTMLTSMLQVLRRVCGNDGRTYDNECELRRQSCLNKRIVVPAMSGDCGKSPLSIINIEILIIIAILKYH